MAFAEDGWAAFERGFARAEEHLRAGEVAAALAGYRGLLAERLAGHLCSGTRFAAADVVVAERLADMAVLLGESGPAERLLAAIAAAFRLAGNETGAAYATLKQAHVALGTGRPRRAAAALQTLEGSAGPLGRIDLARDGWARPGPGRPDGDGEHDLLFAQYHLVAGGLQAALGSCAEACQTLRRGLRFARPGPGPASLYAAPLRLELAAALVEKGELAEAEEVLGRVEAEVDGRPGPGLQVRRLEVAARRDLLRGELGQAAERLREVARRCGAGGFHGAAARAYVNLAQLLIVLNQTQAARAHLAAAGRLAGDDATRARVAWLRRLADARGRSLAPRVPAATELWDGHGPDPLDDAPAGADPAPELPEGESWLSLFDDRALRFQWELAGGRTEGAARELAEMEEVFAACDSAVVAVRLPLLRAMLDYYRHDYAGAEAAFGRVLPRLAALGLKPDQWQALRFFAWCGARLRRPAAETRERTRRARACLDELTASLPPVDRVFFQLNKWTAEEEELAAEVDEVVRLRRAADASRWPRPLLRGRLLLRLHHLLWRIDRYRSELVRERVGGGAEPVPAARWRPRLLWKHLSAHPRDRATLTFLVLPDRVVTFAASWLSLRFAVTGLTRLRLREEVRRWHELARGIAEGHDPAEHAVERAATLEGLSAALGLGGVLDRLPPRVRALILVPDDALHGFPFAAVRRGGRHLVEDYALAVAFSPLECSSGGQPPVVESALLAGVADAPDPADRLEQVPDELDAVGAWAAGHGIGTLRMDERAGLPARREALLDAIPAAALVHVACHGTFEPDRPDRSGLLLFPGPGVCETLTLRDLSARELGGVAHVTLSACWSADSYVLPGRWIISLPEALCRAGAGSVLGSLWPLADDFARAFLPAFYRGLDTLPRDEAVRRVQVAAIEGRLARGEDWMSDPVFWSGLTLYGDPSQLAFTRAPARTRKATCTVSP